MGSHLSRPEAEGISLRLDISYRKHSYAYPLVFKNNNATFIKFFFDGFKISQDKPHLHVGMSSRSLPEQDHRRPCFPSGRQNRTEISISREEDAILRNGSFKNLIVRRGVKVIRPNVDGIITCDT